MKYLSMRWKLFFGFFSLCVVAVVACQFSTKIRSRLPQLPPLKDLVPTALQADAPLRLLIPKRDSEPARVGAEVARRNGGIEQAVAAAELRVWAIRDGHNYGWVQLPKGTTVSILRREGDHAVIRWDDTVVKVPETALRLGALRSDGKPRWFQ
jgi:hypothetical protein